MKGSAHDCSHGNKGSTDRDTSPSRKRERTSSSLRGNDPRAQRQEQKRHLELSAKWDQAKKEVRQEDHEVLKEKIVLQQELIRKQDEVAQHKRQQQQQQQTEKKEEERKKKQAKEKELQQICRQSLEEDKKSNREMKKARTKMKKGDTSPTPSTPSKQSPTKQLTPTTPPTPGSRRSNQFKMTLPAMTATPDIVESDDEDKPQEADIPKDVPWHEQQLYKLYGKSADYFLHPKIENKTQVKKVNPKLRRQGAVAKLIKITDEGRAGAEVLWQTLRHDSHTRLKHEDAHIPLDLKDAYGAFARQSLKRNGPPVRRMFCDDNDLPMLNRLLDNSRVQQIRKKRHKTDLMYRASVSNQDRNEVLMFNNPPPEFHENTESIDQYLPSWIDDQSDDSQPEYLRWIKQKKPPTIQEEGDDVERQDVTRSMDDDLIYILSRRQPQQPKQKYIFLSDKDTDVRGQFSDKYKDEREYKDVPRPYQGQVRKSSSAMGGMMSLVDGDKPDPSLRHSAPLPSRQQLLNNYTSGWQPLTMHSLVEYKKQLFTVGEGDFKLGRTKMWTTVPVM